LNARVVVKRAIMGDHTLLIAVVDTRVDGGVGTYVVTADVAVLAKSTGLRPADAGTSHRLVP
jgi:hypothetical protein